MGVREASAILIPALLFSLKLKSNSLRFESMCSLFPQSCANDHARYGRLFQQVT